MKSNVHQLVRRQPKAAHQAVAPSSAEMPKPPMTPERLLTMGEIAPYLGVSVRTIKKWVAEGLIPHRRLGRKSGRVRFAKHEVDEWSKPKP
jgi:excisionase family DNA binding protein